MEGEERPRLRVVQLRIHGVGGARADALLPRQIVKGLADSVRRRSAKQVGDPGASPPPPEPDDHTLAHARSVLPSDDFYPLTAGGPFEPVFMEAQDHGPPGCTDHAPSAMDRQVYLWGRYRPMWLGLWVALLPFTLVNVAGWAVGAGSDPAGGWTATRRRFGARWSRRATALLGVALTAAATLWMIRIVADGLALGAASNRWIVLAAAGAAAALAVFGAVEIKRGRFVWFWWLPSASALLIALGGLEQTGNTAERRALLAAALATATFFALAGHSQKGFDHYRTRLGGTGTAHERRRIKDEETLDAPCFYDHPTEATALLAVHGLVAAALLAIVATRAQVLPAVENPRSVLAGDAPAVLGRALIGIGWVQVGIVLLLVVTGAIGATRAQAGRDPSVGSLVVNALRPASLAFLGTFLFTAAMGSLGVQTSRVNDEHIRLQDQPHLELVPALMMGGALATVLVLALLVLAYVRNRVDDDDAPEDGRRSWQRWRAVRSLVDHADRLVVAAALAVALPVLMAGIWHRWNDGPVLDPVPTGTFEWLEVPVFRVLVAAGYVVLVLPLLVGAVAVAIPKVRSPLSSLWDVLSFWPRRFHPLGMPPLAERTVPEVQSHLLELLDRSEVPGEPPDTGVEIVAHSQGSVIAFAALIGLRDRRRLQHINLVTFGSPLFALYPRMFPAQVSPELTRTLINSLSGRWVNLVRPTDYFGISPRSERKRLEESPGEESGPQELEPRSIDVNFWQDKGALAHSGYWDATDVAEVACEQAVATSCLAPGFVGPEPPRSFAPLRRMISWFDPRLLVLTAYQAVMASIFGKWADARRLQPDHHLDPQIPPLVAPAPTNDRSQGVWVDYTADCGDAFAPTFAVAAALAQPVITAGKETLQAGQILVLGGDEVYAVASQRRYANQLTGPYALASSCADEDPAAYGGRMMLALPGNHDWYDGLHSFDNVFCAKATIGRWKTEQSRSYWSVRLTPEEDPHQWWLWGVDLQLDGVLDRGQRSYFEAQAEHLQEGDRVVLCSPVPTWVQAAAEPTAFDPLRELIETCVAPQRARVVLHLSGDSHVYARYERAEVVAADRWRPEGSPGLPVQYVTAGGGGAFTHPTHHLPEEIVLPVPYDERPTLRRAPTTIPSRGRSRLLATSALWLLAARNRSFLLVPGTVAALAAFAATFSAVRLGTPINDPLLAGRLTDPSLRSVASELLASVGTVVLLVATALGWTLFGKKRDGGSAAVARFVGLLHGVGQVAAVIVAVWLAIKITADLRAPVARQAEEVFQTGSFPGWITGVYDRAAVAAAAGLLGGLLGAEVLALYLVLTSWVLGMHDNEVGGAVASEDFKHFLRIRISDETAKVWALHVRHPKRVAGRFDGHDPRTRPLAEGTPEVRVEDDFVVG